MLNIEVTVGDALDRLSILAVKTTKLQKGSPKWEAAHLQFEKLHEAVREYFGGVNIHKSEAGPLYEKLVAVNLILWDLEDSIRVYMKNKQSPPSELSCDIARMNDRRHEIKVQIDVYAGADPSAIEVKELPSYE